MSINFTSSLIEAMDASYTEGTLVRTLGFFAPGDGGAAVYKVVANAPAVEANVTVNGKSFSYGSGCFFASASVLELIPQGNKVYAEQFGVMPGDSERCSDNTVLMNLAVNYASSKGLVLAFSPKQTYYFDSSIVVKSNLHIEGNDAVVRVHQKNNQYYACHLFNMSNNLDVQKNVIVSNLTVIGRTTAEENFGDQAFHVCVDGFTLRNVTIKNFNFGVHTYSRGAAAYEVPEIPNKNWLIDNCTINDTVTGLMLSEIDGLTVKDSKISCRPDYSDLDHCIYMASNCLNVRVTNTILCDVSGDAIHKSFAATHNVDRADISKNHFYTDLSIHNADSALDIGIISQNVMCDNVFATEVEVVLQLSGADNCIVSNSNFSQTRSSDEMQAFIYAENACNCWMQNSYVYYEGRHRATDTHPQSSYIECMFADKKHRRMFIGDSFDVPNHWLKFTGCEFVSTYDAADFYFFEDVDSVMHSNNNPQKYQFGEYWDNCCFSTYKTTATLWRMYCMNDLPGGLTIRNSNINAINGTTKTPFRYWCWAESCSDKNNVCNMNEFCIHAKFGKFFPWLHLENNVFDGFKTDKDYSNWDYVISIGGLFSNINPNQVTDKAVRLSNSYGKSCYKIKGKDYQSLDL